MVEAECQQEFWVVDTALQKDCKQCHVDGVHNCNLIKVLVCPVTKFVGYDCLYFSWLAFMVL